MNLELEATIETVIPKYPEISKKAKEENEQQITELVRLIRNATFQEYDDNKIEKELKSYLSQMNYFCATIAGLPVRKENKYLAFTNPKTNSIHVASENPYEKTDSKLPTSYSWSVCNFGSAKGKQQENSLYLTEEELQNDYISKNGEIIGKLCGNCKQNFI